MKNADMPAMPIIDDEQTFPIDGEKYGKSLSSGRFAVGMTKREMMAMHIASGFAADKEVNPCNIANLAIEVTDALLAELERTK